MCIWKKKTKKIIIRERERERERESKTHLWLKKCVPLTLSNFSFF